LQRIAGTAQKIFIVCCRLVSTTSIPVTFFRTTLSGDNTNQNSPSLHSELELRGSFQARKLEIKIRIENGIDRSFAAYNESHAKLAMIWKWLLSIGKTRTTLNGQERNK
jgi:hypothetical protein